MSSAVRPRPPVPGRRDLDDRCHPAVDAYNRLAHRHLSNAIAMAAKEHATGRLLDVGCGLKPYKPVFAEFVTEHIGVDRQDSPHDLSDVELLGGAYELPVEDATFDTVLMTQMLEHLEEPDRALAEAARVLRPSGKLILTAPFVWTLHEEPRDFFRYSPHGLRHLFTRAGLETIDVVPMSGQWGTLAIMGSYALRASPAARIGRPLDRIVTAIQYVGARLDDRWFNPWLSWNHLAICRKPDA